MTINEDGTLNGNVGGEELAGTWEFADEFFCRTLSAGPKNLLTDRATDCQVFRLDSEFLYVTPKKGTAKTNAYAIGN